jgi:four helix bundle protein
MLAGLRQAWASKEFREEPAWDGHPEEPLFLHERLDAYRLSLDFMRWFHALPGAPELSSRLLRQVDKAGTGVVLNIAEGNGRYAPGDRRSLFDIAEGSVVRAGACLELCARSGAIYSEQKQPAMDLLGRIASMLRGLASS